MLQQEFYVVLFPEDKNTETQVLQGHYLHGHKSAFQA